LRILILSDNPDLYGPLTSFCPMYTLRVLTANDCEFDGDIPECIRGMYSLLELRLDSNQLNGTVPEWLDELTQLEVLGFSDNNLQGTLPSLANLNQLQLLSIGDVSGTFPAYVCDWPLLTTLIISGSLTNGPIPTCIGGMSNLTFLWIQNTGHDGIIPPLPHNLTVINLARSYFTGAIPAFINFPNLDWLHLSYNNLSGPFPILLHLPLLTSLALAGCNLTGPVHFDLPLLNDLTLRSNYLTGDLGFLKSSTQITTMNIGYNLFNELTPGLTLPNLLIINMEHNPLKWFFDPTNPHPQPGPSAGCPALIHAPNLEVLNLDATQLSGSFRLAFQCLGVGFNHLMTLSVANNDFTLGYPDLSQMPCTNNVRFSAFNSLVSLNVSGNHISSFAALYRLFIPHTLKNGQCIWRGEATRLQMLDARMNPM
jgi:Leucine-rich repeat (LRR) protein